MCDIAVYGSIVVVPRQCLDVGSQLLSCDQIETNLKKRFTVKLASEIEVPG
jgi:hypothetical protein